MIKITLKPKTVGFREIGTKHPTEAKTKLIFK